MNPITHRFAICTFILAILLTISVNAFASPGHDLPAGPESSVDFLTEYFLANPDKRDAMKDAYWDDVELEAQAIVTPRRSEGGSVLLEVTYTAPVTLKIVSQIPFMALSLQQQIDTGNRLVDATCAQTPDMILFQIMGGINIYEYRNPNGVTLLTIVVKGTNCPSI